MPYNMTVAKVNAALTTEAVQSLAGDAPELVEQLAQSGAFLEVARTLLDAGDEEMTYLEAIPEVVQETIRAAVSAAVNAGKAVQMQYSPAYDFEVRVWDFGGAVGIHLGGPYPPEFPRDRYVSSLA